KCDGAARLERHAGVAADGKLKRNNRMRIAEGGVDVAIALAHDAGLRAPFMVVEARFLGRDQSWSALFCLDLDQFCSILGGILFLREDDRDRLADIADKL